MTKWMLTHNAMKIYCSLLLFAPLISFAQPRYNVVKDNGFENNDTIWVEYKTAPGINAIRHVTPGYESQYSGLTSTLGTGTGTYWGYLEQKLTNRAALDYNLVKNLKYYFLLSPANALSTYDFWYISFSSQKKRLIFLYAGPYAGGPFTVPKEDDTTHIVEMNIPKDSSWVPETLNFYEKWAEKFSETDTIEKIRLAGYYFSTESGPPRSQMVNWDDVVFESTRPDSDAAVIAFAWQQGIPTFYFMNKGAVTVSFPVISYFYTNGTLVDSNMTAINNLPPDSYIPLLYDLPPSIDEIKVHTALPGDQNPSNDTLTKNLGVQEVAVKKPLAFKLWPTLTRGMINYESDKPVTAYDPTGRMMVTVPKGRGSFVLEKTGVYFVKSGDEVKKVVRIE